jgi:hypothetical protein
VSYEECPEITDELGRRLILDGGRDAISGRAATNEELLGCTTAEPFPPATVIMGAALRTFIGKVLFAAISVLFAALSCAEAVCRRASIATSTMAMKAIGYLTKAIMGRKAQHMLYSSKIYFIVNGISFMIEAFQFYMRITY